MSSGIRKSPGITCLGSSSFFHSKCSLTSYRMVCNYSQCPKCKKSTVILPKKETSCTCPRTSCHHKWCRLCNEVAHAPRTTCEEAAQQTITNARTSIEESMSGAYVRQCPRCHVAFVREAGCNKMTCPSRGCGTLSCYICRQVIRGVDHFSDSGCPLYTRDDMTDRGLVQQAGASATRRVQREIGADELSGLVHRLI